jgi:hypothetical protein
MLFVNTGAKFALKGDSGISYKPGKVGPAGGDFDGDGHLDLFIPQPDGKCKLFRNSGTGTFTDVTSASGALAGAIPGAVSAAWGDFDNDGRPDLLVCCLRGANRYFKNEGGGKFIERTTELGLTQKVFNSQAACFADLNGDGQLDLILSNEGQESSVPVRGRDPGRGADAGGGGAERLARAERREGGGKGRRRRAGGVERGVRRGRARRAERAGPAVRAAAGRVPFELTGPGRQDHDEGRDRDRRAAAGEIEVSEEKSPPQRHSRSTRRSTKRRVLNLNLSLPCFVALVVALCLLC